MVLVVGTVGLAGCGKPAAPSAANPPAATTAPSVSGLALGRQIFTTGLGASGQHVAFTGGSSRFRAKPGGCAACHGPDAKGRHFGELTTPNITYTALRGGAMARYPSDEAVLTAIRSGKDEEGQPLSTLMPRWQLTDAEGKALLEQLKALDKAAPTAKAKSAAGGA